MRTDHVEMSWLERAQRVIPNGANTLSKSYTAYPQVEGFPQVLESQCGMWVWDTGMKQYLDFTCGMASVGLGHCFPPVNDAIRRELQRGQSYGLVHRLEIEVAEKLVRMIPCAEQIRFVKTGSEACAGAIRIARMVTGREQIITLGYHGWHDWFAVTKEWHPGIPHSFASFVRSCEYNDLEKLKAMFDRAENLDTLVGYNTRIAAVIMEPTLLTPPDYMYLDKVLYLCRDNGALLIFDEMVTGFRWANAGGQEFFRVVPDLAVFGKAMANGFPLACIAGPEKYMKHAWPISGTFGGGAAELAACDAVMEFYVENDVPNAMYDFGAVLIDLINSLFLECNVPAVCIGYPYHPKIEFRTGLSVDWDRYMMSVLMQGLAYEGILIHQAGFNVSWEMTQDKRIMEYIEKGFRKALETVQMAWSMRQDSGEEESKMAVYLKGEPYQTIDILKDRV